MKKILFIIGSLRENSFNLQTAKTVERILNQNAEVSYLDFANLPIFSQDLESQRIDSVEFARGAVQGADAIWIFSPSYNHSIPGGLKNLLDWLSRSLQKGDSAGKSAIDSKKTLTTVTAASGHEKVNSQLKDLLNFIRTDFISEEAVKINSEAWQTGELILSEENLKKLENQAKNLVEILE